MGTLSFFIFILPLVYCLFREENEFEEKRRKGGALSAYPPKTFWHNTTLDHFSYDSNTQFLQKYLVYDTWWQPSRISKKQNAYVSSSLSSSSSSSISSGPILFYVGNEGDIEDFYNNTGFMFELGAELNALLVFLEHRYYGQSLPFGNNSYDSRNLKFLTIEQALADTALFLANKQALLGCEKEGCDTVLFGGSYGGMLAAWFRLKYPHLSVGALAASAPVDIYPGENKDGAFYNATLHVYERYGGNQGQCASWLDIALSRILPLAQSVAGRQLLSSSLNPCSSIETQLDAERLLFYMQGAVSTLCLFDYPYPTTFSTPLPANAVEVACNLSTPFVDRRNDTQLLWGLNIIANVFVNWTGQLPCHNISKEMLAIPSSRNPPSIPLLKSTLSSSSSSSFLQADLGDITRPWNYQACTELILEPLTSDGNGFYVETEAQIKEVEAACRNTFGQNIVTRPLWMLQAFGNGDQLVRAITNTIFSDGEKDPWRVGGVPDNAQQLSPSVIHLYIEGAAHHQDLRFSDPADPETLADAKAKERLLIYQWLNITEFV